ncbi:enoyl-CoA hydratase/carnithine racemase [Stackebrandtia endophytica]|uniref:Enoyl-CoA hydratase/carnithine racemase n=1 Tax=Stackebrandtia endophytica TaxID=1496996 RepID=A0A543B0W6_9ACTN|nr:enoyl-CoA hydratase/isomerase family protein [Stackebrandtia endophytica]TQL78459.1 enoyl-CoA hydratase/carnithine racemase [Stackebrandtia endophytica]
MTGQVELSLTGRVATITLNRPHRRNALSLDFATDIVNALTEAADADASIAVLRSSFSVFSAGVDLSEPIRLDESSPELLIAEALSTTHLFVITVIEGPALAAALIIAALSPVVMVSPEARFWLPERGIGIFPGRVLAFLEHVMPPRQAFWHSVTEDHIDAATAVQLGLASTMVADVEGALARLTGELVEADPAFLSAARDGWRGRFTTPEHQARRRLLDGLLEANLSTRLDD